MDVQGYLTGTATEWGVQYEDGYVQRVKDRENAEYICAGKDVPHVLVTREVTPWREATQ